MEVAYRTRAFPANTIPEAKLEWVLFDRCVMEGQFMPSSTVAVAETSTRGVVRVSLRLAAPPSISYVLLDTDDVLYGGPPMIVAADGDLLLIHAVVAIDDAPPSLFPGNFFVYKADPEWPFLKLLPSVGDWMGRASHTGIIHSGGKDFVVADLQVRVVDLGPDAPEVAELFRYSSYSITNKWEIKRLDMPYDRENGLYPLCWETDTVFSYSGFMCWADYHRGVLFCDVLAEDPELRFVAFPGIEDWEDFSEGRGLPEMFRTVNVSEGKLCFVDIDDGRFRSTKSSMCSVTTWTLKTPELIWVNEHTLDLPKLWSRLSTENWMVAVDMRGGHLRSYTTYKNAIEEPDADVDVKNVFWDIPLLCSQLCRDLNLPSGSP
ncbi:unnamed protein product [Urochloa humidicola]